MVSVIKDSFNDLEKHRQLLESNIERLQVTLRHWQMWEAEYEGLKEEIISAGPSPSIEQLHQLARAYDGSLVMRKEVEEIIGTNKTRSADQVINLLDRRIDYVQQNVRTIEKQIEAVEHKLSLATVVSTPEVRNEEGLPMTEIIEELDDEDNIIASRISTPGTAKAQLLEVLQKAGVKDMPDELKSPQSTSSPSAQTSAVATIPTPTTAKKEVKFEEGTKPGPSIEKSQTAKRLEEVMAMAKDLEKTPADPPVIPTDESPEDAALRREMLKYGMSEVGAVVAELDLEDESDWSDGEYNDVDTDDEDSFGRSTGQVVTDEIRQQMMELERKLGLRMMENVGKKSDDLDIVKEGIGRVTIGSPESSMPSSAAIDTKSAKDGTMDSEIAGVISPSNDKTSRKKSVRFSEELDVSPGSQERVAAVQTKPKAKASAPVSDIIERSVPSQNVAPAPGKKASKFKAARAASSSPTVLNGPLAGTTISGPPLDLKPARSSVPKPFSSTIAFHPVEDSRVVPTGPEGRTLASSVVEREVNVSSAAEPDELDSHLLHQEVATEYHKMRNRMISRQGGFMKEDESVIVPFTEEEGGPKKISKFKAARLAKS